MMQDPLYSLEAWDAAADSERERLASFVARSLEARFRFEGLELHQLGNQTHLIAVFISNGMRFALLPGYHGLLGFDAATIVPPPSNLVDERRDVIGEQAGRPLDELLTPVRVVALRPILIQMEAEPLAKYVQLPDGALQLVGPTWRSAILDEIAAQGFRFPTSDEWEYACSGGTRTLFRWGNEWPPIQWTPSWQRHPDQWQEDLKPNAFGLLIAQDPSALEYCAEPDILRGGDGGSAASVLPGFVGEWIPLASAYRFPFSQRRVEGPQLQPYLRRAATLPAEI